MTRTTWRGLRLALLIGASASVLTAAPALADTPRNRRPPRPIPG